MISLNALCTVRIGPDYWSRYQDYINLPTVKPHQFTFVSLPMLQDFTMVFLLRPQEGLENQR